MTTNAEPFSDIRVVEFGQFVAVPFCGQLLAEGGAEVIKVESLDGDPNRHMGEISRKDSRIYISRNRGKHALPLKLNDAAARPVLDALIANADVILMNFRPGLAQELGLDPEALIARHPRLIIGEITPFGKSGPDAMLAGMDIVVQARSGLMAAIGKIDEDRPAPGDPVISDYMAATALAFGISSALLRREKTGRGGLVDVSLMQAAMTLANNQLIRHEEKDKPKHDDAIEKINEQRRNAEPYATQLATVPGIRVHAIRSIYFRTYDTADGTIALACASQALQTRFNEALNVGLPDEPILTAPPIVVEKLQLEVEALIRVHPSSHWIKVLNEAGVPVSTVKFPIELFEDEQASANKMFQLIDHESGQLRVLSPVVKLDGEGFKTRQPTKPFASEAKGLLKELGFTDSDIDDLVRKGATRTER